MARQHSPFHMGAYDDWPEASAQLRAELGPDVDELAMEQLEGCIPEPHPDTLSAKYLRTLYDIIADVLKDPELRERKSAPTARRRAPRA